MEPINAKPINAEEGRKTSRSLYAEKGLEISRCFYEEYGREMIHSQFPEYESVIAVGVAGDGSDCFG